MTFKSPDISLNTQHALIEKKKRIAAVALVHTLLRLPFLANQF